MEQKRPHRPLTIALFVLFAIVALGGVYLAVADTLFNVEYSRANLMKWIQSLEEWGGTWHHSADDHSFLYSLSC